MAIPREKKKAFIIRAFGAGDVSTTAIEVLQYLKDEGVPVVVTSQAPEGNANLQVNTPGKELWNKRLVIPAHDMSIESQTAKLMWLLAKQARGTVTSYDQLCELMTTNLRGEIIVKWELAYGDPRREG